MNLLAFGRTADVYALDQHRVLRRYREGWDVADEAAVMTYVAALGFPVPAVIEANGADLVMERLYGPTMLHALVAADLDVEPAAQMLADLHHRLHALPPPSNAVASNAVASNAAASNGTEATAPQTRILHLDLHPDNVVLTPRGPVLIDWPNAAEGPPDFDLAVTAVILAQVAVGRAELAAPVTALLAAFLRYAGGDPLSNLDRAVALRGGNPTMTAEEVAGLPAAAQLVSELVRGSASLVGDEHG